MIGVETTLRVAGTMFAAMALRSACDRTNARRYVRATFWGTFAFSLLAGSYLPDVVNGGLVVVLVVAGAIGLGERRRDGEEEQRARESAARAAADRHRDRVFVPALLVPITTLAISLGLRGVTISGAPLVDPKHLSLVGLAAAALVALGVALVFFRQPVVTPIREGGRLLDMIGWAAILPQLLAALGAVFAAAGVGDRIAELVVRWVPADQAFIVVAAYTVGMALFTILMGNAFAAFPVMTAAIGIPLLVRRYGGDPAVVSAIGMLSGFCGTLMTPMAANFNIVPAALLDLPDNHGVIRVQVPTALAILVANTVLLDLLLFHR